MGNLEQILIGKKWDSLTDAQKNSVSMAIRAVSIQGGFLGRCEYDPNLCPKANDVLGNIRESCVGRDRDLYKRLFISAVSAVSYTGEGELLVADQGMVQGISTYMKTMGKHPSAPVRGVDLSTIYQVWENELGVSVNTEEAPSTMDKSLDSPSVNEESKMSGNVEESSNSEPEEEKEVVNPSEAEFEGMLKSFFGRSIPSYVKTLISRYDLLFESGYDLSRPYGVVTSKGVEYIDSDGRRSLRPDSTGFDRSQCIELYKVCEENLKFVESTNRSSQEMIPTLLAGYDNGGILYYFPYKLLEVAFGRGAVKRGNSEKYNYAKDTDGSSCASDWKKYKAYCTKNVEALLWHLIRAYCERRGISSESDKETLESSLTQVKQGVIGLAEYVVSCLSVCPLIVEYKYSTAMQQAVSLRFRLCDPCNKMDENRDIMGDVCSRLGLPKVSADSVSLGSSLNAINSQSYRVFEYAREFNHEVGNAMPLFAYKAYEALKAKGIDEIAYNDMILGQNSDGTILKNGGKVNIAGNLIHFINAGSRAGKGVMTLNMVSSAIISNKALIYLDNKPDMIVVLSQMCGGNGSVYPPMFALNGSNLVEANQGVFANSNSWINPDNIPLEARDIFQSNAGMNPDWRTYGDLFYMRAYTLAMGMILGRGMEGSPCRDKLNGDNGIFLVCDESSVLQEGFAELMKSVYNKMPPASNSVKAVLGEVKSLVNEINSSDKPAAAQKKLREKALDISDAFQSSNFYALSLLNYFKDNMSFLGSLSKAGFNQKEYKCSDIVIIGQNLETTVASTEDLGNVTNIGRYKTPHSVGLPKESLKLVASGSIPLAQFTSLGVADLLIGYNAYNQGYLKQGDKSSKAYGKLDEYARNFCYIPSGKVRPNDPITMGRQISTFDISNSPDLVYFKPYLLLNDYSYDESSGTYCKYADDMFGFASKAGAGKEDVIAEYSDPNHPDRLNPAVGLPQYMGLMGISSEDIASRLRMGAEMANFVVGEYLGYPDNGSGMPLWLQFVTDLRPEWMLSLRDIANLCNGNRGATNIALGEDNNITKEYFQMLKFKEEYADVIGLVDPTITSTDNTYIDENGNRQIDVSRYENAAHDFNAWDDGSDSEAEDEDYQNRMNNVFDEPDYDSYEEDDEDLFGDINGPSETVPTAGIFDDVVNRNEVGQTPQPVNEGISEIDMLRSQIEELTRKLLELQTNQVSKVEYGENGGIEQGFNQMSNPPVQISRSDVGDISYEEDTGALTGESLQSVITRVTEKSIEAFGDATRIHTFKISGGALVINNEVVTCNLGRDCIGVLPLDIRKQVAQGNISELFDYRYLRLMPNLRTLYFDSPDFVYDLVNPYLGYKRSLAVNAFFEDFKALQTLVIGKYVFTRDTYKSDIKANQLFEHEVKVAKIAAICTSGTAKATKACASFTKNSLRNKTVMGRVFGVTAGVVGTAVTGMVTGVAGATTGVARSVARVTRQAKPNSSGGISRGIKTIKSSIKGLFDE